MISAIKILLTITLAGVYILFFNPKNSPINELALVEEKLTQYRTCEFEFIYPKKWGMVVKSQTQITDKDSDGNSYFITRNFYRFADYDPPKLHLTDSNKGLLWLDTDRDAWGKAEKYKPNAKTFCDTINIIPPVPSRDGKNFGIDYCNLSNDKDRILAEWLWQRDSSKKKTKVFTSYKDLFVGRFSGLIGILETEQDLNSNDKYHLDQLIISAKIKTGNCE